MTAVNTLGRREELTFKGNANHTRYGWLRLTPAYSVLLVEQLLDAHCQPDDVVLDPFCGTGTTSLVFVPGLQANRREFSRTNPAAPPTNPARHSPSRAPLIAISRILVVSGSTGVIPDWQPGPRR